MERLHCPGCGRDFYLNTGCSCCAPPRGPFRCPECGEILERSGQSYVFSGGWDEE